MKIIVVLLMSATAVSASEPYYLSNGKTIETEQALVAALKGETVFKCQQVEAKPNKKGTSISLRVVKAKKGGAK